MDHDQALIALEDYAERVSKASRQHRWGKSLMYSPAVAMALLMVAGLSHISAVGISGARASSTATISPALLVVSMIAGLGLTLSIPAAILGVFLRGAASLRLKRLESSPPLAQPLPAYPPPMKREVLGSWEVRRSQADWFEVAHSILIGSMMWPIRSLVWSFLAFVLVFTMAKAAPFSAAKAMAIILSLCFWGALLLACSRCLRRWRIGAIVTPLGAELYSKVEVLPFIWMTRRWPVESIRALRAGNVIQLETPSRVEALLPIGDIRLARWHASRLASTLAMVLAPDHSHDADRALLAPDEIDDDAIDDDEPGTPYAPSSDHPFS